MKRNLCILLVLMLLTGMLSSCYDSWETDQLAYVTAIGLDKADSNHLKMTLQFTVPSKAAGGGGENGGGGDKTTLITTVETPTIYAGLNMINTYVSKKVNFSHAKIVVFSEELARESVLKYVHAMLRGREFRGSMHIAVARGSAEEYIRNVKPELEVSTARYYQMNLDAFEYTGFTANTQLINFYLSTECSCRQAYATLVGVNKYEKSNEFNKDDSTYEGKQRNHPFEGDFYAGDLPKTYEIKAEIMGLAVFDGGTMVGMLDGDETSHLLMAYGTFNHAYMSIPDPMDDKNFVIMDVKQSRSPKQYTELVDGQPKINLKVFLEADILSIQSGINYETVENIKILESAAEEFHKESLMHFLEKTKELGVDVAGFGRNLKMRYLLWDDWTDEHWLDKYQNAEFTVDVDFKIRRTGLMIRTSPSKAKEGDVMK